MASTGSVPVALRVVRRANQTVGRVAPALAAKWSRRLLSTPRQFEPREWEQQLELKSRRRRLKDGLSFLEAGDGPTVALIHGWEGRATQFAEFAAPLLSAGYRLIAIDGPAHGHSSGVTADPYRFADAILRVAAAEGPFHSIVGHSMGGSAVTIALSSGLAATRAVTIASPASLHEVITRFATAVRLGPKATESLARRIHEDITGMGHKDVDTIDLVRSLDVPAMVIHDRDDREVPFQDAIRLSRVWNSSRLQPFDGFGHRRILRSPDAIAAVVAFLAETPDVQFQ